MTRTARSWVAIAVALAVVTAAVIVAPPPRRTRAQPRGAVDVFINIIKPGGTKLNLGVPEFAVSAGPPALGKTLADVTSRDLTFAGDFNVIPGTALSAGPSIPAGNEDALRKALTEFAGVSAHAALIGLVTSRDARVELEIRVYDLTGPEQRIIATKKLEMPAGDIRRLAHKAADEVVLQFTGERGVADTKMAYVGGRPGAKEIYTVDYDGIGATARTTNGSINLSPAWSPDLRSIAFTSYRGGYPDLYRLFVFERRPDQTLVAFQGINTTPAWSPDGRSIALTVSKDGNPEIYVFNVATGATRRLTRHSGIDTEPTWSPDGRWIAFTSDRTGQPHIHLMDSEGASVRPLTTAGFHTQPRWSPRGDLIAYTARQGGTHEIYVVAVDGTSTRQLTSGGNNESASWAPDGRHLAFQSARTGTWQIFTLLLDGSDQQQITRGGADATSPAWSARLP